MGLASWSGQEVNLTPLFPPGTSILGVLGIVPPGLGEQDARPTSLNLSGFSERIVGLSKKYSDSCFLSPAAERYSIQQQQGPQRCGPCALSLLLGPGCASLTRATLALHKFNQNPKKEEKSSDMGRDN